MYRWDFKKEFIFIYSAQGQWVYAPEIQFLCTFVLFYILYLDVFS